MNVLKMCLLVVAFAYCVSTSDPVCNIYSETYGGDGYLIVSTERTLFKGFNPLYILFKGINPLYFIIRILYSIITILYYCSSSI